MSKLPVLSKIRTLSDVHVLGTQYFELRAFTVLNHGWNMYISVPPETESQPDPSYKHTQSLKPISLKPAALPAPVLVRDGLVVRLPELKPSVELVQKTPRYKHSNSTTYVC
jgi:hypothetical protein